jgi:hypothetical protein
LGLKKLEMAGLQRPLSVVLGLLIIAGAFLPMISSAGIQRFGPIQRFLHGDDKS